MKVEKEKVSWNLLWEKNFTIMGNFSIAILFFSFPILFFIHDEGHYIEKPIF